MNFINKIKAIWKLPEQLRQETNKLSREIESLVKQIQDAEKFIRDRTDVSVDIGVRGPSTVIVTGIYKGVDYVQVFDVRNDDFDYVVRVLQDMRKCYKLKAVDVPRHMKYIVPQIFDGFERS